jgi:TusA-related sulfurtransferase
LGPGQSIQKAIDAANPGDIIEILPGTYNESIRKGG